ncbi:hypothetical protein CR513_59566, partial [Mucuna pruriens]
MKRSPNGKIERYKARLVAKGYIAHFDLELHQMDVKTIFLNEDLVDDVYMIQSVGNEHLVCRLKKSIYGLKHASRLWYLKFDKIVTSLAFMENTANQCIYLKISGRNFIIIVLYVDDILLASSCINLLTKTKLMLSSHFDMKDLSDASIVLSIQIHHDRSRGILGLSQRGYIEKALKRFNTNSCFSCFAPMQKGDKLSKKQCRKNVIEMTSMQKVPYSFAIGSLMYTQVCTRPNIAFVVNALGRYLSNPSLGHWKADKRVTSYSNYDFLGCPDDQKSIFDFIFMMTR